MKMNSTTLIDDTYADFGDYDGILERGTQVRVVGVEDGQYVVRVEGHELEATLAADAELAE